MANITAKINSPTSQGPQQVSVTIPSGSAVANSSLQLKLLGDVDTTTNGLNDGALLQYQSSTQKFVTRNEIETTTGTLTFNGGNY
jgi:hypothetical protein|tara:strand:- start:272 stop:526 length:255 start_codon:yes stop_codon:yes gene_type:complete